MRGDKGGVVGKKKRRVPPPTTRAEKQRTIKAGHGILYPWEVSRKATPPISDAGMEIRRRQRLRGPFIAPPGKKPTEATRRKNENNKYLAALGAPADAPLNKDGSIRARAYLAAHMTPQERREYHKNLEPPPPKPPSYFKMTAAEQAKFRKTYKDPPGSGFLHAAGQVGGTFAGYGEGIGRGAVGMAKGLAPLLVPPVPITTPTGQALVADPYTPKQREEALKGFTGKSLYNAPGQIIRGDKPHLLAAGAELAAIFPPVRAGKIAFGLVEAAGHIPLGTRAVLAAYEARTGEKMIGTGVVNQARRSATLRGIPARARAHKAIDKLYAGDEDSAQALKDQVDAEAYLHSRVRPKATAKQRKGAARTAYQGVIDELPSRGINVKRNAMIEAERNPHTVPLERPIPPLDEAATRASIGESLTDTRRMTSLPRNPRVLLNTFHEAHRLVVQGAEFRQWYETSARAILDHVHGDKAEADKLAQLFAIYSANSEVPSNSILALRAYDEAAAKMPITQGSGAQAKAAARVMAGTPWPGRKTNSFYSNMARHFLSEKQFVKEFGKQRRVTVDVWMMRMFGFKQKVPTDAQYTFIENSIREMARQMGWSPEEVQAAGWVAIKSEWENTTMETAAFDFAHGIDTHRGQISFGAQLADQHLRDVLSVIEPGGRSLIREIVGVPGTGGHIGPEGLGAAHYIPLLRTVGKEGDYTISSAESRLAKEAAAAYGYVLGQPKVAYGRVFQAKSRGYANAVQLPLPEGLTPELEGRLRAALPKRTEIVHTAEGAWLVNRSRTENLPWLKQVEEALGPIDPSFEESAIAVAFDGGFVTRSRYANSLRRIEKRQPGSKQALDRLARDVKRINERHAKATADLPPALRAGGAGTTEHSGPGAADRFSVAVSRSRTGKYGAYVSTPDAEVLSTWRLFLGGPNDEVHYAISPEGDFGFLASGISGAGRFAIEQAIAEGARTADAFDGFLPPHYEAFGFREVARNPWNDDLAPTGWNYERDNHPDVVHMAYLPDEPVGRTSLIIDDWDEAKKLAGRRALPFTPGRQGPLEQIGRTGLERTAPEEEAWRRQHPYRTPGERPVEEVAAAAHEPRYSAGPKSKHYTLVRANLGEEVFGYTGSRYATGDVSGYESHNLYNRAERHIGSIVLQRQVGRAKVYVGSIYIDPKYRGSFEAFKELVRPAVEDGRPIEATFANAKLEKLFYRWVNRIELTPREPVRHGIPDEATSIHARVGEPRPAGQPAIPPPPPGSTREYLGEDDFLLDEGIHDEPPTRADIIDEAVYELQGAAHQSAPEFDQAIRYLRQGDDPAGISAFIETVLQHYEEVGPPYMDPEHVRHAQEAMRHLDSLEPTPPTPAELGQLSLDQPTPRRPPEFVEHATNLLHDAINIDRNAPVQVDNQQLAGAIADLERGVSPGNVATYLDAVMRTHQHMAEAGQVPHFTEEARSTVQLAIEELQSGEARMQQAAGEMGVDLNPPDQPAEFGLEGLPRETPEEEAWRRQHPYRTPPEEITTPETLPHEPAAPRGTPLGPVDPEKPNSLSAAFNGVAVKTSALNARFHELANKLDKTQFEWEEMQRIKSQLRERRLPLRPPPLGTSPAPPLRPIDEIIDAEFSPGRLQGMASQYGKQAVVRRADVAERLQRGRVARAEAGGGLAGHIAARIEQRGELPRLKWQNGLRQEDVDTLTRYIEDNDLHGGDEYKLGRFTDAFTAIVQGRIPTPSQLKLLDEVFSPEEVAAAEAEINFWMKARYHAADVLGLPRALKSSVDFSAPMRQGLFMLMAEPALWAKSWPKGGAAMWSAKNEERMMMEILTRPTAREYRRGGLAIIDDVSAYEEAYATNLAKHIPFVAGSQRGYVMFLNRLRADSFDHLYFTGIAEHPEWAHDETFVKSIAQTVNMLTGRGRFPFGWEPAVKAFSAALFSPRLIASRVEFLLSAGHPLVWAPGLGDPRKALARKMVRRSLTRMVGSAGLVLTLASMLPGVEVGLDRNSSDFLKIKKGDFRLDILGGAQQYIVFASRLQSGEKTNSSTGETKKLSGYGHTRFLDTTLDFLDNKAAPVPAFLLAWDAGRTPIGEPFDPISWLALKQTFAPLGAQSGIETGLKYGPKTGVIDYGLSSVGFGTQVYGPRPPKPRAGGLIPPPKKDPYGGGGGYDPYGGGGGYDPYGGGGGSDPYGG